MNLKEIKEMIALMNENGLTELELERDGLRIRLKKSNGQIEQLITTAAAQPQINAVAAQEQQKEAAQIENLIEIKSPMVGTFYRAPSPESPPYVEIGGQVNPDQAICIIEAMKLLNEIKAEVKGKIKEILVESGSPVEFGQVLFKVEPN